MCLEIKRNDVVLKAKKDITVYKAVISTNKVLTTFYQDSEVEIGKTYESDLVRLYRIYIQQGLHSFKYLKDVKTFRKDRSDRNIIIKIVKCIIPKDTFYYEGYFGTDPSYASEKLVYVEIVKL